MRCRHFLIAIACLLLSFPAVGQGLNIKTNLLYDLTATVNLGVEAQVAPRWSIDLSGNLNAWNINDHRWRHWLVQPEARYWFCEATGGLFLAGHLLGGQYNVGNIDADFKFLGTDFGKLRDYRYEGWFAGAGIGVGYSWILGRHWNLEAEIAVGWTYSRYNSYPCAECGTRKESRKPHNYVGPTKAAINLVYVF